METINSRHNRNLSNVAKFVPKRLRKRLRDNIMGIAKPTTIRRLARRGGVIRIQKDIYDTVRSVVLERLREIIRRLVNLLEGSKYPNRERKTVTTRDVSCVHIAWHGKFCLRV
ncbi:predicted protein [Histoplasma mississippiense (nom. inval.)]|uniref:predicted protein n=1 Tax=Ajellomyces capsulatus (strain NAm1 / WU24) TaxID=2059318 RepID=UPI000157BD85|nr:predicted protein [Histoplasma mississippiense (nom. inval.)]EDN06051.1 predicted protein [Histoplasma mississippiense (nom. inval.)]